MDTPFALLQRSFHSHADPVGSGTRLHVSLAHQNIFLAEHTKKKYFWSLQELITGTNFMNTLMQNLYSNSIQSRSLPRSSTASQSYIPSWCVLTQERIQCQVMEVLYSYRDCFIFSFLSLFFLFSLFFFGDKLTNECIHKQETANMHTRI